MRLGGSIALRPSTTNDRAFLLCVYASTREDELAAWGWNQAQRDAFVQMQFQARERTYAMAYPTAENSIILLKDEPVGSVIVSRTSEETRLVDISLLTAYRNRGIGSQLLRQLITEAQQSGIPLRLSVLAGSPAVRLYERNGFRLCRQDSMYLEMECCNRQ
jgi:ribosomal protein S18 acetylase RimI-like enzyme